MMNGTVGWAVMMSKNHPSVCKPPHHPSTRPRRPLKHEKSARSPPAGESRGCQGDGGARVPPAYAYYSTAA